MLQDVVLSEHVPTLPNDMITSIIVLSCPSLDLSEYNSRFDGREHRAECDKIKEKLPLIAQEIISLRCVTPQSNTYIAQNIASILRLDHSNRDAFLIGSLRAEVPYFVKTAVAHGADCNAVCRPSGFTALLCAAENNNYHACVLLLSKGADVNLKMKNPEAFGYGYNPHCNWPIHMAVKKGDAKMVALFAQAGAKLNVRINNDPTYTLLSAAARRFDPEIVKVLLDYGTDEDYRNARGKHGIQSAFTLSKSLGVNCEIGLEDLHNNQITDLLEQALKKLDQK